MLAVSDLNLYCSGICGTCTYVVYSEDGCKVCENVRFTSYCDVGIHVCVCNMHVLMCVQLRAIVYIHLHIIFILYNKCNWLNKWYSVCFELYRNNSINGRDF